jgi:hypothetical protein
MKNVVTLLALLFVGLTSNSSAQGTVSFTNQATAQGDSSFVNIPLGKFDTGLGTLTGVVVTVNFTSLQGSFDVSSSAANDATVQFAYGIPTVQQSPVNTLGFNSLVGSSLFSVATTPALSFSVPANSSQSFGITGTNVFVNNVQNITSGFWNAYQSAGGVGTVVFQVANTPFIQIGGGGFTLDANAFTATADMTVTYNYTASTAVPEPGTWAVGALLLGGAAFTMWRRRQNAAVDMAATA